MKCPHCNKAILTKNGKLILKLLKIGYSIRQMSNSTGLSQPLICYHARKLREDGVVEYHPKTGKMKII